MKHLPELEAAYVAMDEKARVLLLEIAKRYAKKWPNQAPAARLPALRLAHTSGK
jgi:hypothetical protein